MLQQVRWCLCSAQDGFSCLFSLRNAGLDTYLFLLWETPCCLQTLLWSDMCPVLAPMTPFFYANHTHLLPPLRHQGLCTCCFLELEFSFAQISSKLTSSIPANMCSNGTLAKGRLYQPPYLISSSQLLYLSCCVVLYHTYLL